MGPGRSFVLCIGSNPTEASGLGRTGGESDSLVVVVHRVARGERPQPSTQCQARVSSFFLFFFNL